MATHTRELNQKPSSNLWNSFNRTSGGTFGVICTCCGGTPAIDVHLKVSNMHATAGDFYKEELIVF